MTVRGIGIDLVDIERIEAVWERHLDFPVRVLSEPERREFETLHTKKRRLEYLAGRWAAKEALGKALGVGVTPARGFQDVAVLWNENGAPRIETTETDATLFVSLTHTERYALAIVVATD